MSEAASGTSELGSDVIYAGLPPRLLAATIDNVTLFFLPFIFLGGLLVQLAAQDVVVFGISTFVYLSLWFNYFAFCEWRWGQTVGKNAAAIEVRSLDGAEKLTFGQASIRNLLRLVDFFLIGEVMIAATERKQRLGDKAAKTVVVRR
jgi:uncharacterized RDD family membrane protein YckC